MAGPSTTAQVHPALLTRALLGAAQAKGTQLLQGCVQEVVLRGEQVTGEWGRGVG